METSEEHAERLGRPRLVTLVELHNASARTVWLGPRWFIVPSQLEHDSTREAIRSIEAELGCVCWCDWLEQEWTSVCTRALCSSAEVVMPRESYVPVEPNEERNLGWAGDQTNLDATAKCRYAIGYPLGTEITASLCWYDADPNEDASAGQHCLSQVFHYGDSMLSVVIADPSGADEDGSVGDDDGGAPSPASR